MNFNTKQLFEAKIYEPLVKSFEKLTDLRCARGIRYQLKPVIILLFLSKLGGADTPAEIADWVGFRFEFFKSMLALNWKRSPHEVTWQRILENGINVHQMEAVFGEYLQGLRAEEQNLLNLDGKVRIFCSIFNLLGSETQFLFFLLTTCCTCQRRCPSLAPIVS